MLAILIKSLTEFNSPASDHYTKDFLGVSAIRKDAGE